MRFGRAYGGLESGCERLEELAEFGGSLVLLMRLQFFESGGKGVFERPDDFLSELIVGGRDEVFPMDCAKQFDEDILLLERPVEEAQSLRAVECVSALVLDGLTKRLPSSLNPVNAHRNGFDQIKVLE